MTTEILRNLLYNKKIKSTKLELSIEIDVYQGGLKRATRSPWTSSTVTAGPASA